MSTWSGMLKGCVAAASLGMVMPVGAGEGLMSAHKAESAAPSMIQQTNFAEFVEESNEPVTNSFKRTDAMFARMYGVDPYAQQVSMSRSMGHGGGGYYSDCPECMQGRGHYHHGHGGALREHHNTKTRACIDYLRCKFGYFIPSGNGGTGVPLVGKYSRVYPQDVNYFDQRDGQLYAAPGYGVPMAVPLAPVVGHQYNYGWGVPSSRLTPISHPLPQAFGPTGWDRPAY